jgi:hypothetical protein
MTPEKSFARLHEQQTVCANRLFSFLFETNYSTGYQENAANRSVTTPLKKRGVPICCSQIAQRRPAGGESSQ